MTLPVIEDMLPLQRSGTAVAATTAAACTGNAATATTATTASVALAAYSSASAKPAAAVGNRAGLYVVLGAPGAADVAYISLKNADNSYSWIQIATGV